MSEHFFSLEGPLDALPGDRQTRAANLSGFPELARRMGGDPWRILERHGIDPRTAKDPESFIACQSLVDALEYCGTEFNDPLFGLRLALAQEPDIFGCVTALCRSAPTVTEAIEKLGEYMPIVHSPESLLELVENKDVAELRWGVRSDLGLNEQAHYQTLVLFMKLLRMLGGPRFAPSYVSLAMNIRSQDLADIESQMGCQVRSRGQVNAIAFPRHVLDQPVATQNRLLYRLVDGYLSRVKSAARTSIVERVEDYVRGALPSGNCSVERCAEKLGVSVRTLQVRLSGSGVRFSDILEHQRIELAKEYLKQDQMCLDEVAILLGYSEQTSFGRAFKRWTGSTPQRFRSVQTATAA
ncbi:AraC family transcriptional regulator ligand-binding domain-containing protein [Phenylobacterium sp. LjRoot219]|uniref:AraC family transcriptional regulator n=1 Tax=Phenylobacterium sp. LjRoot219 TaxID=3342283 RepID=UPI003ECEF69D